MKRAWWLVAPAIAPLAIAASLSASPGCDVEDPVPPSKPSFAKINEEILKPNCTFACHSGGENAAGGLDLSVDPRAALVDAAPTAAVCAGIAMKRVAPGDPDSSLLYVKLAAKADGRDPACGDSMPPGADLPALTGDQIELVRSWIAAGAPAN